MLRTRVGYAGGQGADPTYRRMLDHTEVFQVDYDPAKTSFAALLKVFWASHDPCRSSWGTQYDAILFYESAAEKQAALASAKAVEKKRGRAVQTRLEKLGKFYFAEDYHQKYRLRGNRRLFPQVRALFASERAFSESTAAARINAFLDGYLDYPTLQKHLAEIGLIAVGEKGLESLRIAPPEKIDKERTDATPSTPKAGSVPKPESRPSSRPSQPSPRR